MVGPLALDQLIGVRVPASQPTRRERSARDLRPRAHRLAARPDAASIASLVPRCVLAPAARGSSLDYLGRLLAPRPEQEAGDLRLLAPHERLKIQEVHG